MLVHHVEAPNDGREMGVCVPTREKGALVLGDEQRLRKAWRKQQSDCWPRLSSRIDSSCFARLPSHCYLKES